MDLRLKDKVALVTGSGSPIGYWRLNESSGAVVNLGTLGYLTEIALDEIFAVMTPMAAAYSNVAV